MLPADLPADLPACLHEPQIHAIVVFGPFTQEHLKLSPQLCVWYTV